MDLQLQDDVAVVIGAARGMGLAVARAFADEGCRVVAADRDETIEQAADSLSPASRHPVLARKVDVTDELAVRQLADWVGSRYRACHHVVCAAGAGSGKYGFPFWNLEPRDWEPVWQVNVLGAVHVAHAFAPALRQSQRGTLLFFSSVAAQIGSQTDPPYSAAKAAVLNFAECAAKDLAPYGVRVNTICPGMVKTELNQSVWQAWHDAAPVEERQSYEAWAAEKIRHIAPLGRWQQVEEVAAMAVFLASPHAMNMTGQAINIDGGQVMHW